MTLGKKKIVNICGKDKSKYLEKCVLSKVPSSAKFTLLMFSNNIVFVIFQSTPQK